MSVPWCLSVTAGERHRCGRSLGGSSAQTKHMLSQDMAVAAAGCVMQHWNATDVAFDMVEKNGAAMYGGAGGRLQATFLQHQCTLMPKQWSLQPTAHQPMRLRVLYAQQWQASGPGMVALADARTCSYDEVDDVVVSLLVDGRCEAGKAGSTREGRLDLCRTLGECTLYVP